MKKPIMILFYCLNFFVSAVEIETIQLIVDLPKNELSTSLETRLERNVLSDIQFLTKTISEADCVLDRLNQKTYFELSAHYIELNVLCDDQDSFSYVLDFLQSDYLNSRFYELPNMGFFIEVKALVKRTHRPSVGAVRRF